MVPKIRHVPVTEEERDRFKRLGRELRRCPECKESWGKRTSAELLKRHKECSEKWIAKWSKRPA
jgi:hypothetical protein